MSRGTSPLSLKEGLITLSPLESAGWSLQVESEPQPWGAAVEEFAPYGQLLTRKPSPCRETCGQF